MANLQDFYTSGIGSQANAAAPGMAAAAAKADNAVSGTGLAKDIVTAWALLFGALTAANFLIRKFGR